MSTKLCSPIHIEGFLKCPSVYCYYLTWIVKAAKKAAKPNPHLETSSHSNGRQFLWLRASQWLSKVLALRISLTNGPEHDFILVNSPQCQEIRLCLFVMLTNNLFNSPFYIFKEELGQWTARVSGNQPSPISTTRIFSPLPSPGWWELVGLLTDFLKFFPEYLSPRQM